MPIRVEIADSGKRVVFLCSGRVTGQDIIDSKLKLLADRERVSGLESAMVSFVDAATLDVGAADVRALADIDRQIAKLVPRAAVVIVAHRDHDFGLARMWEGMLDIPGWSSHVFRTQAEAEKWLAPNLAYEVETAPL